MTTLLQTVFNFVASLLARSSIPDYRGEAEVPGLQGEVRVRFDSHGVPHIAAGSEEDLFFAQGYVHAQDRLFQMDFVRRAASGRLAETVGDEPAPWKDFSVEFRGLRMADLDHFLRILGLRRAASASLEALDERTRRVLDAYALGV
ncbi:MAG: penicillin acylase family protein, partial [Vicinamibacteria bacterium]